MSSIFQSPLVLAAGAVAVTAYLAYKKSTQSKNEDGSSVPPPAVIWLMQNLYRFLSGMTEAIIPPHIKVLRLTTGFSYAQILHVVCELNVADHLSRGPLTPRQLAEKTGAIEDRLRRVMRALVQRGIFCEHSDGSFSNNSASEYLRDDHPETQKPFIGHQAEEIYTSLTHLMTAMKKEVDPTTVHFNKNLWQVYKDEPSKGIRFAGAMTAVSKMSTPAIVNAYGSEWNNFTTVADVGGSQGTLLEAIMYASPKIKGILFDLPEVIEKSEQLPKWKKHEVSDRVSFVRGSFFEEVPTADIYTLRMILHDWNDTDCIRILKTVRKSIKSNGKLLILDQVFPSSGKIKDDLVHSMFTDLIMLCIGGKERTPEEFESLFKASGFKLNRIIPTASFASIVEAVPI